jgi:hypothetical protein
METAQIIAREYEEMVAIASRMNAEDIKDADSRAKDLIREAIGAISGDTPRAITIERMWDYLQAQLDYTADCIRRNPTRRNALYSADWFHYVSARIEVAMGQHGAAYIAIAKKERAAYVASGWAA